MRETVKEGLSLVQQLAALPFRAARQAFKETPVSQRPLGSVVDESLSLGEGLARLPFKLAEALVEESAQARPRLEERVAALEQRAGIAENQPQ